MHISIILIVVFIAYIFLLSAKYCPSRHIMIVYDKSNHDTPKKIIGPGQVAYVFPFTTEYVYLSLMPIAVSIQEVIFKDSISETFNFNVAVSQNEKDWKNAAKYLAGLSEGEIKKLAKDLIKTEMLEIAKEATLADYYKDKQYLKHINHKLGKIGLELIQRKI